MLSFNLKKIIVDKLILQYQTYLELQQEINSAKFQLLKTQDQTVAEDITSRIKLQETVLNRISDEMSFPTPTIWIMYKYLAYKNTEKEIKTVGDFIDHCSPDGYICTKRFIFLNQKLTKNIWDDKKQDLSNFFLKDEILDLEENSAFMNNWLENEFKIVDNKISKWN